MNEAIDYLEHNRLADECAKLDIHIEQQIAENGLEEDIKAYKRESRANCPSNLFQTSLLSEKGIVSRTHRANDKRNSLRHPEREWIYLHYEY